ncbi:zf-HC2 domain-containing protein [Promicromonospora soli]
MTAARALQIDDWVVHRPNVVRSVAARVPGIDAEEATSRALEKMVRIVSTGATIDDPAPYWRRAAVNEAISMTREAGRARPVEDDTLDGLTPPVAGAELDAERQADVSMLRTALSDLGDDDRQILLDRHVHDKAVTDIATGLGVRPHAVTMRLRRAEERLAGAFAAAHAQAVNEPECRTTRAAMHDYLKGRLLPRRQQRLEVHMDGCAECTRAFIDVREVSWMLRDYGQHIVAGAVATGALGAVVGAGAAGAAGGGAAGAAGAGAPRFGKKEAAIVAGVLAALAAGGGAMALVANQPDEPPAAQSVPNPGAGDGGGGAGGGAGDGANGDGTSTSDGASSDLGTKISDWLSSLGIGEGSSGVGSGTDTPPETSTADDDAGNESDGGNQPDDDGSAGTTSGVGAEIKDWLATLGFGDGTPSDAEGEADPGMSGGTEPGGGTDGASPGNDGPTTADGTGTGIGAEMTSWLGRLGAIGIPGFLLIVVILWLWERWSRTEDG